MSLLLNFHNARKRWFDSAPADSADHDSRRADLHDADSTDNDNVFDLLPPENETAETEPPAARNVHPIDAADLSRLAIDSDGRLYWDGKPVEVHRRLLMSRQQIVGALVIGAFIVVGAVGAALQGTAAARDWACRFGWATSVCAAPGLPRQAIDIPA
jgi:hypothetical protein